MTFELCADSLEACIAARDGGAGRIELCSALSEGGLTPSHALVVAAIRESSLPVYPILRPRGGDFVYSEGEFALIRDDLAHAKELGASGFVIGFLDAFGRVDKERTQQMVDLAAPLEVTFHRAFDCTTELSQALEDIIATGCRRLLTSGGRPSVVDGAQTIRRLVKHSSGRIEIAAGGGLRLENAAYVAQTTSASSYHGSMRTRTPSPFASVPGEGPSSRWSVNPEDIRAIIRTLDTNGS